MKCCIARYAWIDGLAVPKPLEKRRLIGQKNVHAASFWGCGHNELFIF
jgi:hypothetical protein